MVGAMHQVRVVQYVVKAKNPHPHLHGQSKVLRNVVCMVLRGLILMSTALHAALVHGRWISHKMTHQWAQHDCTASLLAPSLAACTAIAAWQQR